MAESNTLIMIDDSSQDLVYGNGNWGVFTDAHWYNASGSFAKNVSTPTITCSFNGTSIAFAGNIPGGIDTNPFMVSIDDVPPYSCTFNMPHTYKQWYQSPLLDDGLHTITIGQLPSIVLDYVVVTAGPQTPLTGSTLAVDNNSSEVSYSGQWTIKHDQALGTITDTIAAGGHALYPFGNGTHESTHIGDTATLRFEGTSVSVYTVRRNLVVGTLNVSFTVDQLPPVPVSGNVDKQSNDQQNFVFYQTSGLQAGIHTLTVNVTALSEGMVFSLDYFTYEPSFNFLSEKPSFSMSPTSSITSATQSETATAMSPSHGKSQNIGGIIGGTISGAAVILVLAVMLMLCRRRRRREKSSLLLPVSFIAPTEDQSSTQRASTRPGPFTDSSGRSPRETMRRRADKLERYVGEAPTPITSPSEDGRLEELQRQIDALVAENARRLQVSPPAYSDGL